MVDGQWKEVPHFHRWTVKLGPKDTEVQFALHVCPAGGKQLKVSELLTGHDTRAKVIDPRTGRVIEIQSVNNKRHNLYLPGHEVRKLARNAVHRLLKQIGEMNFLTAVATVVGNRAADVVLAKQQAEETP